MFTFCFKSMIATYNGVRMPMRVDTETGMIDMWQHDIGDWIWSTVATEAFKKLSSP
jgi:hypothetical protein